MSTKIPSPDTRLAETTIKWVGGKRKIASQILEHFPRSYGTYYEPFLGGASVFLAAKPGKAKLSDLNPSLINYYIQLRDRPREVLEMAEEWEKKYNSLVNLEQKKSLYYEVRNAFNSGENVDGISSAVNFLFLNKTAFNGLYRENSNGQFNVPFNNRVSLTLLNKEQFLANSAAFSNVELKVASYLDALAGIEENDLVYFDPPYVPISATSAFSDYTKSGFGLDEQIRLRDTALDLVSRGVKVILSNSHSPLVAELYSDFALFELDVKRLLAASSNSRGTIQEYLIVS